MAQAFETLKNMAVQALYGLFTFDFIDEQDLILRASRDPDVGDNIFAFTFGAPDGEDFEDAKPYLALLVEVNKVKEELFDCKVIHCEMVDDPKENSLSYEQNLENSIKREHDNHKLSNEPPREQSH